jgi:hypothetical protein
MNNFLETLIAGGLGGAMRGGMEGLLMRKALEEKMLAETMGQEEGIVPVSALAALMKGGWTGRPDVDFQLSPYGEFNPMEHREKGYAYMESPQAKAGRLQREKLQAAVPNDFASQMFIYLSRPTSQGGMGWNESTAKDFILRTYGNELPQDHWLLKAPEPEKPVPEEQKITKAYDIMRGLQHAITPTTRATIGGETVPSGKFGERAMGTALEPNLLRSVLEKQGLLEKPPAEKIPKTQEEQGEELFKRGHALLSKIPIREYEDEQGITQKGRIPQTPQEHEAYNLAMDYIDRGLKMMDVNKINRIKAEYPDVFWEYYPESGAEEELEFESVGQDSTDQALLQKLEELEQRLSKLKGR